jgi:CBS domain containing-hemolysin-like protein
MVRPPGVFCEEPIDTALGLLATISLIGANAFFVAAEFGLVSVDRGRIERDAADGDAAAARVLTLLRSLSISLSGAQLGITLTSLLLGFSAEPAIAGVLGLPGGAWTAAIALSIATVLQMVLGELVPKALAISSPDRVARRLARFVRVYSFVAGPLIRLFDRAANRLVRAMGVEPREELHTTPSRREIERMIQSSGEAGALTPEDVTLLTRTIRFTEKTAADVLVPRTQVEALPRHSTVTELVAAVISTGYSRFPVYRESLDDIVGVVLAKSIYAVAPEQRDTTAISAIMNPVLAVPEGRDLDSLFADLRRTRSYLSVVVDEHGGTAGIVTLEDLLEEIVGEIDDEYDITPELRTIEEQVGVHLLAGTLHHDEVLDACGLDMPEGDYETLAGFMLDRLGRIPDEGDTVDYAGWLLAVVSMDKLRVATVRVTAPPGIDIPADPDIEPRPLRAPYADAPPSNDAGDPGEAP